VDVKTWFLTLQEEHRLRVFGELGDKECIWI